MSRNGTGNGDGPAAATISDDLIAKARAIAGRSDELLHLLEDARQKLVGLGRDAVPDGRFQRDGTPEQKPVSKQPAEEQISDGLRLLIAQMSVSDASREEIAARLHDEFSIANPEAVLRRMGL